MPRVKACVVHEQDRPVETWAAPEQSGVQWRTLLSADRTPSEAMTMGVAEVPLGGATLRLHRHAQPEVYFVLSGEGVVQIDGEAHAIRTGSAVFIPGNAEHGAFGTGAEVLRLLYVFPTDSFTEVEYHFSEAVGQA